MSGFIVRGRDITLDLGRGVGRLKCRSFHIPVYCITCSHHNTPRAEYRSWNKITFSLVLYHFSM